jgi:hypothetical protein
LRGLRKAGTRAALRTTCGARHCVNLTGDLNFREFGGVTAYFERVTMRSEQFPLSPYRRRPLGDRVDRLLGAAFADEPRFRDAFLQMERGRRSQTISDALPCDDADGADPRQKRA